jgi:hypothetical protein
MATTHIASGAFTGHEFAVPAVPQQEIAAPEQEIVAPEHIAAAAVAEQQIAAPEYVAAPAAPEQDIVAPEHVAAPAAPAIAARAVPAASAAAEQGSKCKLIEHTLQTMDSIKLLLEGPKGTCMQATDTETSPFDQFEVNVDYPFDAGLGPLDDRCFDSEE